MVQTVAAVAARVSFAGRWYWLALGGWSAVLVVVGVQRLTNVTCQAVAVTPGVVGGARANTVAVTGFVRSRQAVGSGGIGGTVRLTLGYQWALTIELAGRSIRCGGIGWCA